MDAVIDRATLDAFVDGALTPEEAARVVMHLADAPAAQAHVDATMELNALLAEAFGAPLAMPAPKHILAALEGSGRKRISDPIGLRARGRGALRRATGGAAPYTFGAAAAAAAMALGVWLWPQGPAGTPENLRLAGPVPAGTSLYEALETRGSGLAIQGERGTEIAVIATYLDSDRRPCREFEVLQRSEGTAAAGVACRDRASEWVVAFAASRPLQAPAPSSDATPDTAAYIPAAGVTDAAVSGALDALGAGPALVPEAEERLIANAWRP